MKGLEPFYSAFCTEIGNLDVTKWLSADMHIMSINVTMGIENGMHIAEMLKHRNKSLNYVKIAKKPLNHLQIQA